MLKGEKKYNFGKLFLFYFFVIRSWHERMQNWNVVYKHVKKKSAVCCMWTQMDLIKAKYNTHLFKRQSSNININLFACDTQVCLLFLISCQDVVTIKN